MRKEVLPMDNDPRISVAAHDAAAAAADDTAGREVAGCCCRQWLHDSKQRSAAEYKKLMNRLKRIEGQVQGIERMVERDAYCPDILTQVSAVSCALNSFSRELLAAHIRTCVADDIRAGNDATIDELVGLTQKLMR